MGTPVEVEGADPMAPLRELFEDWSKTPGAVADVGGVSLRGSNTSIPLVFHFKRGEPVELHQYAPAPRPPAPPPRIVRRRRRGRAP